MTITLPARLVALLEAHADRVGCTSGELVDRFTRRLSVRDLARVKRMGRVRASSFAARNAARARGDCTTCRKRPAELGRCRCVECNAARKRK
jgi:phage FluMu protein gp41